MAFVSELDYSIFRNRRDQVIDFLNRENTNLSFGAIILFADFESDRSIFRQESSFYYLTGIVEPGAVLLMFLDGSQYLYLPNYGGVRERWTNTKVKIDKDVIQRAKELEFDELRYLGEPVTGYSFNPVFTEKKYMHFLNDLKLFLSSSEPAGVTCHPGLDPGSKSLKKEIFTLLDLENNSRYFSQIQTFRILLQIFPSLNKITRDLAPVIHFLRRFKSEYEIDLIYKAIQVTSMAHEAAAKVIMPGRIEHEVQAIVESVFIQAGACGPAFPSIVATGKNTTVLHYIDRDHELCPGDLVVVDIGAEYGYYASDLTRTYPVSGKFTQEQLEIYNIVLNTQKYIESVAKPGMFLNNSKIPEKSLNHLARKYLDNLGFAQYFAHGIGHFLGLDVHDVDTGMYPLASGDVFTIEPGIYIPEKKLGIRIEDDYLMTDDGVVCLSFELPRTAQEIEELMKDID
ncbi:MAG: aminopeptidase P N-terminal domain-containing protein [bacterium]